MNVYKKTFLAVALLLSHSALADGLFFQKKKDSIMVFSIKESELLPLQELSIDQYPSGIQAEILEEEIALSIRLWKEDKFAKTDFPLPNPENLAAVEKNCEHIEQVHSMLGIHDQALFFLKDENFLLTSVNVREICNESN